MPRGAAGSGKTASGQRLLDAVLRDYPHVLAKDRVWLLDRLWHGAGRLAALGQRTHFLARLKSDIELKTVPEALPDGSCRAEVSGDGVTMEVRVIECHADVEGQEVPGMFCLITDLLDWQEYPAIGLARLYKRRRDGSETPASPSPQHLPARGPERHGHPDRPGRQPSRTRPPDRREHQRLPFLNHPITPQTTQPARGSRTATGTARRPQACPEDGNTQSHRKENRPSGAKPRKPESLRPDLRATRRTGRTRGGIAG